MFKLNAMKKTVLMILLSAAMLQTQAQDYLISFAGVGNTTVVTTVNIDNLTSKQCMSSDMNPYSVINF